MLLAACGLMLSIVAHGMALLGLVIPGGRLVWVLHFGIFVVWIPTGLTMMWSTRYTSYNRVWKQALGGCPVWMRSGVYLLFGYAMFNFILFMATMPGNKPTGDAPPSIVRGFSGHWMVFYGAAFAILYSAVYAPGLRRERKCPQGHTVSPTARYCSDCGHMFPDDAARSAARS